MFKMLREISYKQADSSNKTKVYVIKPTDK